MKILTLTQPYATLIALLAKLVETRSWGTMYRGPLAIHAAQGLRPVGGEAGLWELCNQEPFRRVLWDAGIRKTPGRDFPHGAIVAVAELVMCHHTHLLPWNKGAFEVQELQTKQTRVWALTDQERAFGDYSPNRFAWLLADIRPLRTPLPYRGAQGLRPLPAEVIAEVLSRV